MKIWFAHRGTNLAAVTLFLREPQWQPYAENWSLDDYTASGTFWRSRAEWLHRALTGDPIPPWPLLSEIEICEGKPVISLSIAAEGDSYTVSSGSVVFETVSRTSRQVRVWCPPDYEPPKGWVWDE